MKITERRLRQIIRSVIKESNFSDDLGTYMGPDPVQGLGPADPEEEDIRYDKDGNPYNAAEEVDRANKWNEQFPSS